MIAYLDNAATTKPCDAAVRAMTDAVTEGYFNPSSQYGPAVQTERAIGRVRGQIRAAVRARPDGPVLFTSGGTEANNLALLGHIAALRGPQHIISSAAEHPSVLAPLDALRADGHRVTLLSPMPDGSLDWAALERALDDAPALVSLMHVNNEMGAVLDVPRLSALVRERAPGAKIHVDAVQGFLRLPLDMRQMDMLTVSAHKIHGPKGVGALVLGPGVRIKPRQLGGGQQDGLRSGTENVPGILGFGGAMAHMMALGDVAGALLEKKRRFLAALPEALLNGTGAPHIVNLSFPGVRGEVLLHALEADGVYCSTGAACSSKKRAASPALLAMGIAQSRAESALRFSFCPDTTDEQIDYAAECISRQCALLRRFQRR